MTTATRRTAITHSGFGTMSLPPSLPPPHSPHHAPARVYAILSVQLIFTALVIILFGTYPPLANLAFVDVRHGKMNPLAYIPLGGALLSTFAWMQIIFRRESGRKSPDKWWWLSLFTVGEAVSVGFLSSLYRLESVVLAMGATALASVTVSAYTILNQNSKHDLSQWGATLSSYVYIVYVAY